MSGSTEQPKDAARRKAQNYFTQTERRDELVRQELEKERVAGDAKIAKLRARRLAKEAVDKIESDRVAAEKAEAKANAPKRASSARPRPKLDLEPLSAADFPAKPPIFRVHCKLTPNALFVAPRRRPVR